jgi:hypothetical protein
MPMSRSTRASASRKATRVAESARQRVLDKHPEVLDVLVHVDAENDLLANAAVGLPDRALLLAHLKELLAMDPPEFERTTLHYLGTRVEAEVFLPPGFADEATLAGLRKRLATALPRRPLVRRHPPQPEDCTLTVRTTAFTPSFGAQYQASRSQKTCGTILFPCGMNGTLTAIEMLHLFRY